MKREQINGRKVYRDPMTGDLLTRSDWISWQLQTNVIRRWWFLILFTFITLTCVLTFSITVMAWWNVLASYLAIFVEAIVGRYMAGQTRRDATVLREIRKIEVEDHAHHLEEEQIEGDLHRMVKTLYEAHLASKNEIK
jgi:ABC-type multidrug transport system fused ATPase/permease subunit